MRLGLRLAGDPHWFHGLSPVGRLDTLALTLPPLRKPQRRPRSPRGKVLHDQVAEDADLGWLFEEAE